MSDAKSFERFDASKRVNIPKQLVDLKQWVCWRLQKVGDKDRLAKVPVSSKTLREASVIDSRTWSTLDEALSAVNQHPELQGVGFVFTTSDPYCGIDIDDCRDPATGTIGDWAQCIIKTIDTYTEVSPSGTGVKMICEAQPPGTAARRNKVEIYYQSRYFTITGEHLKSSPIAVEKRQAELSEVYLTIFGKAETAIADKTVAVVAPDAKLRRVQAITDENLLKKAREAANGEKFKQLYDDGSLVGYGDDRSRADAALCSILCFWTRADVPRMDRLFRASALFRKKWDERRGSSLYGEITLRHAVGSASALYDPDLDAQLSARHNDTSNAEIFIQQSGDKYRWCSAWKSWLSWNDEYWERDAEAAVRVSCEQVAQELIRRASTLQGDDLKREMKWAIAAGDIHRLNAIETISKARLAVSASLFDTDPYVLCCSNGVVDLRTGDLATATQDQWITRSTYIKYDEKAKCDRFELFLAEIMENDKDMISYLWRVLGYALTGLTTERAFFILHGNGRNGKSTFVETIRAMMGGYAQKARFTTFLKKTMQQGGANDDVAHLSGARFVSASEADSSAPLDVSLVKELTGSDSIRARHLYGREFEFLPQFKLFFATNHIPSINESTYALWDRLHYIGFNYRVPEKDVDKTLGYRLLGELEGILSRSILGCMEWREKGLCPPDKVLQSREELHEQMDVIGQFFAEHLNVLDRESTSPTKHSSIYEELGRWAKLNGIRYYPSSRSLANWLRSKGYQSRRGHSNVVVWPTLDLRSSTLL